MRQTCTKHGESDDEMMSLPSGAEPLTQLESHQFSHNVVGVTWGCGALWGTDEPCDPAPWGWGGQRSFPPREGSKQGT